MLKHKIRIIGLGAALPDKSELRANGPLPWLALLSGCRVICATRNLLDQLEVCRNELWAANNTESEAANRPEPLPAQKPGPLSASPLFIPLDAHLDALADRLATMRDQGEKICILAGGDPLFYGIGASLTRYFAPEDLEIFPGVSAMQEACARLALPWADVRQVSLHGRSGWREFDCAALSGRPICLLLDEKRSLPDLAGRLIERGRANYRLHYFGVLRPAYVKTVQPACATPKQIVCPQAGEAEQHLEFDLEELHGADVMSLTLQRPGLVLLLPETPMNRQSGNAEFFRTEITQRFHAGDWPRPFLGMPDELFQHEAGLISKQPVRAAILAALRLRPWHTLLDIGAGCGSVGIEACALLPEGRIFALEKQPGRIAHILFNRKTLGAVNLEVVQAEAEEALQTSLMPETVDRIFIGGGLSGDKGRKLLEAAWANLAPGGRLVASCVLLGNLESCLRGLQELTGQEPAMPDSPAEPEGLVKRESQVVTDSPEGREGLVADDSPAERKARVEICAIQAGVGAALAGDTQLKALNQVFILAADK